MAIANARSTRPNTAQPAERVGGALEFGDRSVPQTAETTGLTADFAGLYAAHQRALRAYIVAVVPDRNLADEVFQQTSLVLCEKFSTFEAGTNFAAWAYA